MGAWRILLYMANNKSPVPKRVQNTGNHRNKKWKNNQIVQYTSFQVCVNASF